MRVSDSIQQKLTSGLEPERLEVTDESHLHAGHSGAREGGESHFRLLIVSTSFEGLSRVARQRLVNDLLREELSGPVHALAMKTLTPAEAASQV
ncbi:MAG: BolA family transcriptional regulator [Oricola sp.]|jgi:BolA family transcriptional regulator, general stress-responsive regulator|nr:BolA family transcriptional regulator [Oricola sp.]